MGQILSEPVTKKDSAHDADARLSWASSSMQGWRVTMEDAHTTLLELNGKKNHSFFAVYDGHGGSRAAEYSGRTLARRLALTPGYESGDYSLAIKTAFLGTDVDLRSDPDYQSDTSGCTAVCVLFTEDGRLFCGNAGDSRAVLSSSGQAEPLSFDHKPTNEEESARIFAAGGFIEFSRVNGNLALSRAIGDFEFKSNKMLGPEQQIVTANPEITERTLGPNDEFVVVACDGIWDVLSNQQVVDFVRQGLAADLSLEAICERMMERCLAPSTEFAGVGCDNMTVIIIAVLNGKPFAEWKEAVAKGAEPLPSPHATEDGPPFSVSSSDPTPITRTPVSTDLEKEPSS